MQMDAGTDERRIGLDAIPKNIQSLLTELQLFALSRIEGFGWSLKFVRRPSIGDQVVVLVDPSGNQYAVLHEDGSLDRDMNLDIR